MAISTNKIAEMVGISAVIGSLIFVALELRQSNRIAVAAAEAELRSATRELNLRIAENTELSELSLKLKDKNAILTPLEEQKAHRLSTANFAIFTQANQAFENGLLSPYSLNIYSITITDTLNQYPGLTPYFARIATEYGFERGNAALWDALLDDLSKRGYDF